jgi:hypothetical protein
VAECCSRVAAAVDPGNPPRARFAPRETRQYPDSGRFPGAVRSEEAEQLSWPDLE